MKGTIIGFRETDEETELGDRGIFKDRYRYYILHRQRHRQRGKYTMTGRQMQRRTQIDTEAIRGTRTDR